MGQTTEQTAVETLREAAALMREQANAAAEDLYGTPSTPDIWRGIGTGYREPIKKHIASWDPATALAVADLLETVSYWAEPDYLVLIGAQAIARACLSESV